MVPQRAAQRDRADESASYCFLYPGGDLHLPDNSLQLCSTPIANRGTLIFPRIALLFIKACPEAEE